MKVLVLGGTKFVGRHIVERLLANGHDVTLFHRGQTNPDLFPNCKHVHGDRKISLEPLAGPGQTWDAAIDTCGYIPREIRIAAETLKGNVGHFTFISTISVYSNFGDPAIHEDSSLIRLDDPSVEEITGDTYGGLKVLCEEEVFKAFGAENVSIVRPGIVFGPHDHTDRFNYWVARGMGDGKVLTPKRIAQPAQWIDGRDLAEFTVKVTEERTNGIFNSVGHSITLDDLLNTVGISQDRRVPADEDVLQENEINFPLTLPQDGSMDGIFTVSSERGQAAGLTFRSLETTTADVREWLKTRDLNDLKAGPSREKEQAVIDLLS